MTKIAETGIVPEVIAKYEAVIGLEVHAQLLTKTKIFCGCSTRFGDAPNANTCPVCLGLPGTLPVLNKRAVELAMQAALALNCTVHEHSRFARKNYFYPDLPKGYQISQYELPLATAGRIEIEIGGAKNLNSFRFLQKALEHEIERHIGVIESGGRILQETRLWHQAEGYTVSMRSKEKAHDYRYFPEPDLLPVHVSPAWREAVKNALPELPEAKRSRFVASYGISPYDAGVLTSSRELADYFEAAVKAGASGKAAANWMQTDLLRRLNDSGKEITESPVSAAGLSELIKLVEGGKITAAVGKKVFAKMVETGGGATQIVEAEGLGAQVSNDSIEQIAREVIEKNPENVAKFKSGNEGVFKFFVGQVIKATRGQANPQTVNEILKKLLGA